MNKSRSQKRIRDMKNVRSPLFYVGDKYKLMKQLNELFPSDIDNYYDVFCGGGSASLNVIANAYYLNDIDKNIIKLHKLLQKNSPEIEDFIKKMHRRINRYGLSLSENGLNKEIEELKSVHKKTYFAKYNKSSYLKLRDDFNANKGKTDLLYLLLIYGFNHMIRFNSEGEFNLPVGNVDWNSNVTKALIDYAEWFNSSKVVMSNGKDFEKFVNAQRITNRDFLYFDPPYLITFSDYNKLWNEAEEKRLYKLLDDLDAKGVRWGLSNMLSHKGKTNEILLNWANKYYQHNINSNYISSFDNTVKQGSNEIYVTNYME